MVGPTMPMAAPEKTAVSRIATAAVTIGVAALFALMMLGEWWPIVVARSPARIATYHFGTETMIRQGGWRYANPQVYAWTSFAEAMTAVAAMPILWITIVRRSRRAAKGLILLCVAYAGLAVLLGRMEWTRRTSSLDDVPVEKATAHLG
jgi:hypothetical protein